MNKNIKMTNGIAKAKGFDDKLIDAVSVVLSVLVLIVTLYPIVYVISASFSSPEMVALGKVTLFPKGFTVEGYRLIFEYNDIWIGYRNSLFYMIAGTMISLTIMLPCAYSLSRKNLPGGKTIMLILFFSGYASGGLIPTYLAVKGYGLLDTVTLLLIINAVTFSHILIARTYFISGIPYEMQEAATIDGCSYTGIFIRIMLPLSMPVIAVIGLYNAVTQWNSYFEAMIYITDRDLYPLQIYLRNVLILNSAEEMWSDEDMLEEVVYRMQMKELMKFGLIVVSSLPLMILYPFVQKFFVKGVMIGAVKG